MNKKIILILFAFLTVLVIFSPFKDAKALEPKLEVVYPGLIPGIPPPTTISVGMPSYVRYLYVFAIVLGAIFALLMLVLGGLKYSASVGSPEKMGDAINQISASIFGLAILFCSFLILNTINPQLIVLEQPDLNPPLPPDIAAGVYLCIDRVDINYFYSQRGYVMENPSPQGLQRLNYIKEKIDKYCKQLSSSSSSLPEGFEDKIIVSYLVPVYKKKEFGVIIFEERNFGGTGRILFGNQQKGGDQASKKVMEWPVNKKKIGVSSALPFEVNRQPETSWYVKLYELVHFNRDDFKEKYNKKTCERIKQGDAATFCDISGMAPTDGCGGGGGGTTPVTPEQPSSPGDSENPAPPGYFYLPSNKSLGYKSSNQLSQDTGNPSDYPLPVDQPSTPIGQSCPPKISSVNIEGSLFIAFFKEKGDWSEESEIFVIPKSDTTTYDDIMAKWIDSCKEKTPENPEGRRYPCAVEAVTISGNLLY